MNKSLVRLKISHLRLTGQAIGLPQIGTQPGMAVLQDEWPQQKGRAYGGFRRYNPRVARSQLRRMAQWAAVVLVAVTVGSYYLWSVRATGNRFYWGYDLGGYYNYLGRAFARGRLYLP